MYFLDTDVLIDILRKYPPSITWINSARKVKFLLSGFVFMELVQGCRNREQHDQLFRTLNTYKLMNSVKWPSVETCKSASDIFSLYHLSHGISIIDVLVGQHASDMRIPLCTFNGKHYEIIPGIVIHKPYEH